MDTNTLPRYDMRDNPTGCCLRFDPEQWDDRELHFEDKLFLKTQTRNVLHVPVNMGSIFEKTISDIERAGAFSEDDYVVLSFDPSSWRSEHYFSVTHEVPDHDHVRLSGDYVTKVFEGPYGNTPVWMKEMEKLIDSRSMPPGRTYFFYTTCPSCAKVYGTNYVVAVTESEPAAVAV